MFGKVTTTSLTSDWYISHKDGELYVRLRGSDDKWRLRLTGLFLGNSIDDTELIAWVIRTQPQVSTDIFSELCIQGDPVATTEYLIRSRNVANLAAVVSAKPQIVHLHAAVAVYSSDEAITLAYKFRVWLTEQGVQW